MTPSTDPHDKDFFLPLDAFVRSVSVGRSKPHTLFLGAGASVSSGIPTAEACIWEWKRNLFLSNNPGLEELFSELSLTSVRMRIQDWLDGQGSYPEQGAPKEYSFYIQECFPIPADRRRFFEEKVKNAQPRLGYRLMCRLALADLFRSVWTTNFDGLAARAAAGFSLTPWEVGIDSQKRLPSQVGRGQLLCVSLHGDYRYDNLKNTSEELRHQEEALGKALRGQLAGSPVIVCGYSGRDDSIMKTFSTACEESNAGALYWCGNSDEEAPERVADLIAHARRHGRDAYYIPGCQFDDLMTRLALHCLKGESREAVLKEIAGFSQTNRSERHPFQVRDFSNNLLIKSNAFAIECPREVLSFDLQNWPADRVWAWLREHIDSQSVVAVVLKGRILALGKTEDIKKAFSNRLKGPIERLPVVPKDLRYENGAIIQLMRKALVRSLAETAELSTDGESVLWRHQHIERQNDPPLFAYESLLVSLRWIGSKLFAVLKPSIKVLDGNGTEVSREVEGALKLRILGYQHNNKFNIVMNEWRLLLLPESTSPTVGIEFPAGRGSAFKFHIKRAPAFGQIGLPHSKQSRALPKSIQGLIQYRGLQLPEPQLLFHSRHGTGTVTDTHPIRGVVQNRPFDFPLTTKGLSPELRIGVICPVDETAVLAKFLNSSNRVLRPTQSDLDYLLDYPGFQKAFGLPLDISEPDTPGWHSIHEPTDREQRAASRYVAQQIISAIDSLRSSYSPNVILIFFPQRWEHLQGYRDNQERFDVHDFVKAYAAPTGISTQFLQQKTLSDAQQCRVWWWLSLALYAKGMRTPWLLKDFDEDSAYIGLGYSIDRNADIGNHIVLGCSHIYSARGEGLQFRLSKIENPIIRRGNPFMSREDARRTGSNICELFFASRSRLPRRVVLHKRTPFMRDEREGLLEGLREVEAIDLLEIQEDPVLRYVASSIQLNGTFKADGYPVRRGTVMRQDDFTALLWVHGSADAVKSGWKYYKGKRRIPSPLSLRRAAGHTSLEQLSSEILGLSKMNWNSFDLYSKFPATLQSSGEIARIGSLLPYLSSSFYDYRLFI